MMYRLTVAANAVHGKLVIPAKTWEQVLELSEKNRQRTDIDTWRMPVVEMYCKVHRAWLSPNIHGQCIECVPPPVISHEMLAGLMAYAQL